MSRKIKDLNPGQAGWTVPWALHEAQGRQWLHPDYPAGHEPFGTLQMKVTALAPKGKSDKRYYYALGATVGLAPFGGPEKKTMDEELKSTARQLHTTGLSAQQIANRLAIDVRPVWRALHASPKQNDECCSDCGNDDGTDPRDNAAEQALDLSAWEQTYWDMLSDLSKVSSPEELTYAEDKILELGGSPNYVKQMAWLDQQNRLIKEICPEVEKAVPAPRRAPRARPKLHVFHACAAMNTGVATVYFVLGSTIPAVIWLFAALMMFFAATIATKTR